MKSPITTHVLDVQRGKPAAGMAISLSRKISGMFVQITQGITDSDGRITNWLSSSQELAGSYQITFHTQAYFQGLNEETLYPRVVIEFDLKHPEQHYHIPLLLSANGFTTYRGS